MIPRLTNKQIANLWSKIQIGNPDECWLWQGTGVQGYGRIKIQGKNFLAHRVVYFLDSGIDPKKRMVCHTCDNPACCNPRHLWLGTAADNTQDSIQKGRRANLQGTKHGRAKLTNKQIRQIRKQYANGITQRALGQQYGVAKSTIYYIVNRKHWTHI